MRDDVLCVTLVIAVNVGEANGTAFNLPVRHRVLQKEFRQQLSCGITGSLAVFRRGQVDVIVLSDPAGPVGLHRVDLGSGAVDKDVRLDLQRLGQKGAHTQNVGLEGVFHMIKILGMHYCGTIDID